MQITLAPALTAGSTWLVISCRLLCVLMQTTSGLVSASTFSKSVVIFTSHGRPSSSPTVLPSLAGLVTMHAGEVDVLRPVEDEPQQTLPHRACSPLHYLDHVASCKTAGLTVE